MNNVISSGEQSIEATTDEWTDVLEVQGHEVINWITVVNEGDFPGFWRLVAADGDTAPARLPCGGGEPGERRATVNIPCPGFSGGRLQVKKPLGGGHVTGLFAFGMK